MPAGEAAPAAAVERAAPGRGRRLRRAARGRPRGPPPGDAARATSTCGTSTSCGWPTATRCSRRAARRGRRRRHPLPRAGSPHPGHGAGSAPGPEHARCAEQAAGEILSLPLFPGITPGQQERVVDIAHGAAAVAASDRVGTGDAVTRGERVTAQEQEHLGTRAASGVLWLAAQKWVVRVSGFATLVGAHPPRSRRRSSAWSRPP